MVAMYAVVIPFCFYTAGEPRKAAMIAAQKLADEKWAKEAFSMSNLTSSTIGMSSNDSSSGMTTAVGVPVEVELSVTGDAIPPAVSASSAAAAATSAATTAAANAVAAEAEKMKRDKDNREKDALERLKAKAASGLATVEGAPAGGWFSSWFGPSKEQKQAKAEFDKWQKQFNERSSSGPVSLPPEVSQWDL
jgi:hypothetical protein